MSRIWPISSGLGGGVPPPGTPVLANISTVVWKDGQAGIVLFGSGFGDQIGIVRLSAQGRNQADRIALTQSVTSWSDSSVHITAAMPQFEGGAWPGYFEATLTTAVGEVTNGIDILISPSQGFVELTNNNPQAVINARPAGTAYWCDSLLTEKTLTLKTGDTLIGGPNGGMRGAKDISTGWVADGSLWRLDNQTQSDTGSSGSRIDDGWHGDNDRVGAIWIGQRNC